jgi:DNA-binding SARP family transcriptional activator
MSLFCLKTFGGLSVSGLDGAVTSEVASRLRALSLLALLAVAGDNGVSRERVMSLLWPEADDAHARNNLKQLVFAIRRGLAPDLLDRRGACVWVDFRVMRADVVEFERAIAAGDLKRAAQLYTGPFLDGFHMARASEFDRWAEGQRDRLGRRYEQVLERLARHAGAVDDLRGAVDWWRCLAQHDRVNSEYAIGLIDALADAGEPLAALRYFAEYTRVIREEFDVDPEPSVRAAVERVRQRLANQQATFAAAEEQNGLRGSLPPVFVEPRNRAPAASSSVLRRVLADPAVDD